MSRAIINVPLEKMKQSQLEPAIRMKNVGELVHSMQERGQLSPITVAKDGSSWIIVDGHRRWTAAKRLGWATLEAIERKENPVQLFVDMNGCDRALRGSQWISLALAGAELPGAHGQAWTQLREWFDISELRRMHKKRPISLYMWNLAKAIGNYCDMDYDKVLRWIINSGTSMYVLHHVRYEEAQSPRQLAASIRAGRKVKVTIT